MQLFRKFNKAVKELIQLLNNKKQKVDQNYLAEAAEYSLRRATKRLKRPQLPIALH